MPSPFASEIKDRTTGSGKRRFNVTA
jgi:hypothetical protein